MPFRRYPESRWSAVTGGGIWKGTTVHQPPTLATFLDYGGDLSTFPGLDGLAEAVIVRRRLQCKDENQAASAFFRACVAQWLSGGPRAVDPLGGGEFVADQAVVTAFSWAADCYDDSRLAERFERSIPADLFVEHIQWANERRARAV